MISLRETQKEMLEYLSSSIPYNKNRKWFIRLSSKATKKHHKSIKSGPWFWRQAIIVGLQVSIILVIKYSAHYSID